MQKTCLMKIKDLLNSSVIALLFSLVFLSACSDTVDNDEGQSECQSTENDSDSGQYHEQKDESLNHFGFHEEK